MRAYNFCINVLFPLDKYLDVEVLDHMIVLFKDILSDLYIAFL